MVKQILVLQDALTAANLIFYLHDA